MGILLTGTEAAAGGAMSVVGFAVYFVFIFGALWFFMIRPQKKEQKDQMP